MRIGIIGSGNMGSALGAIWARQGHDVTFSYVRDANALQRFVDTLTVEHGVSARAGLPVHAAEAEVVMLAVPWAQLDDALLQAGSDHGTLDGCVVLTCVSPLRPDFSGQTTGIAGSGALSAAERIAERIPRAHVVEAFNTTFAEVLSAPDRDFVGQRPSILYCGDNADAKTTAATLIESCGYEAVDVGGLTMTRSVEALASLWVQTAVTGQLFPQVALRVLRR